MSVDVEVVEILCLECGVQIADDGVCEECFQDKLDEADDNADEDVAAVRTRFANKIDQLGDRIRDGRGDRESWWTRARDIAAELRKHG